MREGGRWPLCFGVVIHFGFLSRTWFCSYLCYSVLIFSYSRQIWVISVRREIKHALRSSLLLMACVFSGKLFSFRLLFSVVGKNDSLSLFVVWFTLRRIPQPTTRLHSKIWRDWSYFSAIVGQIHCFLDRTPNSLFTILFSRSVSCCTWTGIVVGEPLPMVEVYLKRPPLVGALDL
jgi:hypothetical protein